MDPKVIAEMGLGLLEEAVLWCLFNSRNERTKRDALADQLGIPFELGHELLKRLEASGMVVRDSQASYWRLSERAHAARSQHVPR